MFMYIYKIFMEVHVKKKFNTNIEMLKTINFILNFKGMF